jgi:hypothetical protein
MTRNLISFAAAASAALALSACGSEQPDAAAESNNATAAVAQVQLPPSIQASRTYRCADNSIVYIDFYTNNTAQLRTEQTGPATALTAEAGNPPYLAEGYSVAANADTTRIETPGRAAQSCRAGRA